MPVSLEEMNGPDLLVQKMNERGITHEYLVKQLKKEFNSKEPKIIKVKGAVDPSTLPSGFKIVAQSGVIEWEKKENGKEKVYGTGETIIRCMVRNAGIAQKARQDAIRYHGLEPAQKHEHSGKVVMTPQLTPEDREVFTKLGDQLVNAILEQHRNDIRG